MTLECCHFQVRAEQIQSDLEELVKALNGRCKGYGLRAKPTALVELPFGIFRAIFYFCSLCYFSLTSGLSTNFCIF